MTADVDQVAHELLDDLTVACQVCGEPAEFITWLTHPTWAGPLPKLVFCGEHKAAADRHFTTCHGCGAFQLHAEPLR